MQTWRILSDSFRSPAKISFNLLVDARIFRTNGPESPHPRKAPAPFDGHLTGRKSLFPRMRG